MDYGFKEYKFDNRKWDIKERFSNIIVASKYSTQCSANDNEKQNEKVLIKKINIDDNGDNKLRINQNENEKDKLRRNEFLKKAYKEIIFLKTIVHENVISLVDIYTKATELSDFKEYYIVTTYMDTTLRNVLRTQKISNDQIIFLTYQILRGLKYLHSMDIIHKNLNPNNIAINENLELKIQNFEFNSNEFKDSDNFNTDRFYKSPEILLKYSETVHKKSDVWSVGCILVEMYTNETLFLTNDNNKHLRSIFKLFTDENKIKQYFEDLGFNDELSKEEFDLVKTRFNKVPIKAKAFVNNLMQTDLDKRISIDDALQEDFMKKFHDPQDEPVGEIQELNNLNKTFKDDDEIKLSIYNTIKNYL